VLPHRERRDRKEVAMDARIVMRLLRCAAAGLLIATAPALADTVQQLDNLAQISTEVAPGIAFARNQIGRGDLLGAIATLERLLINHPESDEALLLHASLLCRVDDPTGSLLELDALRNSNISDRAWREATAPCGDDDRPGSGG
jgi:uncharacterized protein HemY